MTAAENLRQGGHPARHPLAPGATEATVRAHLRLEDQPQFDEVMRAVHDAGDSNAVARQLEQWRRVAVIQRDPDEFVRIVRRVAEHKTGAPIPEDEPLAVTRAKAEM